MRARKAERERVTVLLESEQPDVDALAQAVFDTVSECVLQRDWWVLVAGTGQWVSVFGPYGTRNQAVKAVPLLELRGEDIKVIVRKLAVVGSFDEDVS